MTITVNDCARCGGDHKDLEFHSLTNPPDDWNWWAMCPEKYEPVFLRIINEGEGGDV